MPALAAAAFAGGAGPWHALALGLASLAPVGTFFVARRFAAAGGRAGVSAEGGGEGRGGAPAGPERWAGELERTVRDLRAALEGPGRGLLSVGASGGLEAEPSGAVVEWFGPAGEGDAVWDYLGSDDERARDWLRLSWEALSEDVLPVELAIDQLPASIERGGRTIGLEYRPSFEGGVVARVLVVATDVSARIERERLEAERRETLNVCQWLAQDRAGFVEFLDEGGAIVARLAGRGARSKDEQLRLLHTLKGNASLFGLSALVTKCHKFEGRVVEADGPLPPAALRGLAARWESLAARAHQLLGGRALPVLELDDDDYEALRSTVARGASKAQLLRMLDDLRREPAARRLERIAEQARHFARRLGKDDVVVRAEANRLRLPAEAWAGLWSALAHAVRNALDHGVESADERRAAGKAAAPCVTLRARLADEPDFVDVEVEDDGRGIDWERVRQKARAAGLPCESAEDLHEALFRPGLSTKDAADEQSGRGAGMGALREACAQLGGTVRLWSEPGRGTRVRARMPLHADATSPASRRAQAPAPPPSWAQEAGPLSRFATIDGSALRR